MDNDITSPTNDNQDSASPVESGAGNPGSLNEDQLANLISGNMPEIRKASQGGRKISFSGEAVPEAKPEVESNESEEELDLSLLDNDSSNEHTNVEAASEDATEPEFDIQVDGQQVKVKQSEMITLAQKGKASEEKFREASNMRKEADELMSAYQQERETLKGLLNHYQNFIEQSYKQQEPNWDNLYQNDPLEYFKQKEVWQAKMQQVQAAKAHQDAIKAQEVAEKQAFEKKYIESQRALMYEKFPTWKDEGTRNKAAKDIVSYLVSEGFSQDDTNALTDVRLLQVAHKAAMYDKLVKANEAKKVKPSSSQTLKAGAATNRDPGFADRQRQTQAARDAKAVKDQFRANPTKQGLEDMILNSLKKR